MSTPEHPHPYPEPNGNWQHRGSCRGAETSVFFAPDNEPAGARRRREQTAKQICQQCPVLNECRDHALSTREPYGIWGGLTERDRARHHHRTRIPHHHRVSEPRYMLDDPGPPRSIRH